MLCYAINFAQLINVTGTIRVVYISKKRVKIDHAYVLGYIKGFCLMQNKEESTKCLLRYYCAAVLLSPLSSDKKMISCCIRWLIWGIRKFLIITAPFCTTILVFHKISFGFSAITIWNSIGNYRETFLQAAKPLRRLYYVKRSNWNLHSKICLCLVWWPIWRFLSQWESLLRQ